MGTSAGVGFSQNLDPRKAAQEAARQAKGQLKQERIDFALIFNSIHYDPKEFLPVLYEDLHQTKIIGASTAGLIMSDRVETRGIGVMIFHSDTIKFETGALAHMHLQNMNAAGANLAKTCITDYGQAQRKLFLFFVDSLLNNLADFITGLSGWLGPGLPALGGGCSDDFHFKRSDLYHHNQIIPSGAAGVLLGGHFKFGANCQHGWRPLGKPRKITSARGDVIQTIDGKKAIEFYEEYFDAEAGALGQKNLGLLNVRYPLGIHNGDKNEFLLRHIIEVLDDGSLRCQDQIPDGQTVHIMIGSKESCLQSAEEAALKVKDALEGQTPRAIIIIESLMRYRLLGRYAAQEIAVIRNILGNAPLLGMYAHGQICDSQLKKSPGKTLLHNGSIILLAVG